MGRAQDTVDQASTMVNADHLLNILCFEYVLDALASLTLVYVEVHATFATKMP